MNTKVCVATLVATLCCSLSAQLAGVHDSITPEYSLNPVVVTAMKTETKELTTPADVTVITARQIKESGATNAFDALSTLLGSNIESQGFNGAAYTTMTSKIMIRGVDKGTLVLINGIKYNQDGKYNLEDIPADLIQKIEVVRGGGSVLYGSEATGGVINIITKNSVPNSVSVGVGNYGKHRYGLTTGNDKISVIASMEKRGFAGPMSGYAYGSSSQRHFDYSEGKRSTFTWNYNINDELTFTHNIFNNYNQFIVHDDNPKTYNGNVSEVLSFRDHDHNLLLDYLKDDMSIKLGYNTQKRIYDKTSFAPKSGKIMFDGRNSTRVGHNTILEAQKVFHFGEDKLVMGASFQNERLHVDGLMSSGRPGMNAGAPTRPGMGATAPAPSRPSMPPSPAPTETPRLISDLHASTGSVYVSYDKKLSEKDNLIISARETWLFNSKGKQYHTGTKNTTEISNKSMSRFTPEIQYLHRIDDNSSVYAKVGQSFRLPTLTQVYGTGVIYPALDLKPEHGTHYEVGYKVNKDKASYRATLFAHKIKDAITVKIPRDGNGKPLEIQYYNQDVKNIGIELASTYTFNDSLSGSLGIMYNNPKTRSFDTYEDNEWHPYFNKWQLTGALHHTYGKLHSSLSFNYLGDRTADNKTSRKIKPMFMVDLDFNYKINENQEVQFHINNLLDRLDITTNSSSNFYTLGQNYMLTYSYKF